MPKEPKALAGLSLERGIRLRWALRDIQAQRTKVTPVSPDDLQTLIVLGLVEIRNELPVVTAEGLRALE